VGSASLARATPWRPGEARRAWPPRACPGQARRRRPGPRPWFRSPRSPGLGRAGV